MRRTRRTHGPLDSSLAALYLPPDATAGDARRAFRTLMRQLHPDTSGATGTSAQIEAVVAAYRDLARAGFLDGVDADGGVPRTGRLLNVWA